MVVRVIESLMGDSIESVYDMAWDRIHTDIAGLTNAGMTVDARRTYPKVTEAISYTRSSFVRMLPANDFSSILTDLKPGEQISYRVDPASGAYQPYVSKKVPGVEAEIMYELRVKEIDDEG